jgi:hypothetical protein
MKYLFRKLFKRKKRYYPKPSFKHINSLETEIYQLRNELNNLAHSLDRTNVNGVYMDKKDAKKYKNNSFICH